MESRTVAPNTRAAVFAAVCTLLAAAAHLWTSGVGIPVGTLVFGAAAVFCFARIAACDERGLVSIGLLVGGSQIGLHLLFQAVQSASGDPGTASMSGMQSAASAMGLSPGMTAGHVLAAAVAAWWLRRGEAAVFASARWTGELLTRPLSLLAWLAGEPIAVTPSRPLIRTAPRDKTPMMASRLIRHVVIRRGPPVNR